MPTSHAFPVRLRVWIALILALTGLGVAGRLFLRPTAPERVLILASHLEDGPRDLGPGMAVLLADLLEVLTGATVIQGQDPPVPDQLAKLPSSLRLLRFTGRREGDNLTLALAWITVADLQAGRPWRIDAPQATEPQRALEHLVQHWPLTLRHRSLEDLIPRTPSRFWRLLDGLCIQDDHAASARLPESWALAQEEPGCATAWTVLGDHLYRSLWVNPDQAGIGLSSRTHQVFQRVMTLSPGHPRATFLWSLMLTDTGNQSLALTRLQEALRLRPSSPDLYIGVAYACRTSGLLEGARKALVRRSDLLGSLDSPSSWVAETTYLYLGDLAAFHRELTRAESLHPDASILFYRGYLALIQGAPQASYQHFRDGCSTDMTPAPFLDLCRAYTAHLEGRDAEGLRELRRVDEVRGKLRIPDGEWTFKEAEAYALLGDADRAMECATRAFVQGFSCAAWYETSPFLEPVRKHPRWPSLHRNIRERQAELEAEFPPTSFEPRGAFGPLN